MYSRILVAVDDSRASKLAMREAVRLAQNQHAKLCVIYVVDEFIPAGEGVPVDFEAHEAEQRVQGQLILDKMIGLALKAKVKVEGRLIEMRESNDVIPQKIVKAAKKWRADLIVMGTHGRRGLRRFLLGSVAEEVTRTASVPVHLIRAQRKKKE